MPIKKGDRLFIKMYGMKVPAKAASDDADGHVQIKLGMSNFATINAADAEVVPQGQQVNFTLDFTTAEMTCPTCGAVGDFQAPAQANLDGTEYAIKFACKGHHWSRVVPAKFPD